MLILYRKFYNLKQIYLRCNSRYKKRPLSSLKFREPFAQLRDTVKNDLNLRKKPGFQPKKVIVIKALINHFFLTSCNGRYYAYWTIIMHKQTK